MALASKLFVFRSDTSVDLGGFSADAEGEGLPPKFGPWTGVGVVRPDQQPPHGLKREDIDSGVAAKGYQLFRRKTAKQ